MLEWIDKYNNLIQIIINLLSFIATIVVSLLIYWLQKRHECEIEKIQENIRKSKLEDEAHSFLIDNEEERGYLPYCVFAANLYRHEKHTRKIYTNFCRCSLELQNEILRISQFHIRTINDTKWVSQAIESLRIDIKEYGLSTRDFLYDDAKYFHRAFENYREIRWEETPRIFAPVNPFKQFLNHCFTDGKLTIEDYIEEFFVDYIRKSGFCISNPMPPFDLVWKYLNLHNAKEETVCRWMLDLIIYSIIMISNHKTNGLGVKVFNQDFTGAQAETYEDRYLEALYLLYIAYV